MWRKPRGRGLLLRRDELAAHLARLTRISGAGAVQDSAAKLGFDYGSSFQRAHSVAFPHPKRAIVALEPVFVRSRASFRRAGTMSRN